MKLRGPVLALVLLAAQGASRLPAAIAARRAPSLVDAQAAGPLALERAARRLGPAGVEAELAAKDPARRAAALAAVPLLDTPALLLSALARLVVEGAAADADAALDRLERITAALDRADVEAWELAPELARACAACAAWLARAPDDGAKGQGLRCAVALARVSAPADATRLVLAAAAVPALREVAVELADARVREERPLIAPVAVKPSPSRGR